MPYTLGLLASLPRLDDREGGPLRPIPGAPPSLLNLAPGCPFSPRCTYRGEVCDEQEPELLEVAPGGHRAACHFSDELEQRREAAVLETDATLQEELA